MKGAASAVIFALTATLAARADDAKAPLADAKQQLQQLQRDEVAAKSGTADSGLKGALPELQTTLQGREALPSTVLDPNQNSNARNQARKDRAAKNWLVDGYDRLDPKAPKGKKDDRISAATSTADDAEKDPESPAKDDLIMNYEKQAASADATTREPGAGAAPSADPLAPFLQGWLAKSPVRDAALASLAKTDGAVAGAPSFGPVPPIPDLAAAPVGSQLSLAPNDGLGEPSANPYMVSVNLPSFQESAPVNGLTPSLGGSALFSNGPVVNPAPDASSDSVAPPTKVESLKPPPTPADEDKKYFPQLKRF